MSDSQRCMPWCWPDGSWPAYWNSYCKQKMSGKYTNAQ